MSRLFDRGSAYRRCAPRIPDLHMVSLYSGRDVGDTVFNQHLQLQEPSLAEKSLPDRNRFHPLRDMHSGMGGIQRDSRIHVFLVKSCSGPLPVIDSYGDGMDIHQ